VLLLDKMRPVRDPFDRGLFLIGCKRDRHGSCANKRGESFDNGVGMLSHSIANGCER
jgi:hypothetical protein